MLHHRLPTQDRVHSTSLSCQKAQATPLPAGSRRRTQIGELLTGPVVPAAPLLNYILAVLPRLSCSIHPEVCLLAEPQLSTKSSLCVCCSSCNVSVRFCR